MLNHFWHAPSTTVDNNVSVSKGGFSIKPSVRVRAEEQKHYFNSQGVQANFSLEQSICQNL